MDENLVGLVAQEIWRASPTYIKSLATLELAKAALNAINKSKTHWVAPVEATPEMASVYRVDVYPSRDGHSAWSHMREAYLANSDKTGV